MPHSPTEILREEHELVLMVVEAMEREVASIEHTDHVNADRVANMVDFTRNFTDGCHHAKEEKILFPLLEQRDPAAGGPVSVMLSEHDVGRQAVGAINGALPDVVGFACDGWFLLTGLQRLPHQRSTPCLQAVLPFSARSFLAPGDPVPIRVMTQHFECPDPQGGM